MGYCRCAALTVHDRAVCRWSHLLKSSERTLATARLHLRPSALAYSACCLCRKKSLMVFSTLVVPERIRQIFYSLAAKMCDFILQKIMRFNLQGIVFLLGIPRIFNILGVIEFVTFSNLIIFIIQRYIAFNETVLTTFHSGSKTRCTVLGPNPVGRKFFWKLMPDFQALAMSIYSLLELFIRWNVVRQLRSYMHNLVRHIGQEWGSNSKHREAELSP